VARGLHQGIEIDTLRRMVKGTRTSNIVDPFGMFVDSYSRMAVVLENRPHMDRRAWFKQLGNAWESCDNIARYRVDLRRILQAATRDELDLMMTAKERRGLAALPERVEVWRGCYHVNRSGLSWSLDQATAAKFPTFIRYRRDGDQPILRRGIALRDKVVLKLDRNESEIIAPRVFAITEVAI
jgi:hypothetical protein